MQDFEKLGLFYLGRPYDLSLRRPKEGVILYDSRDLLTHAVCIGMTGSGKTGLCVSILEEAAVDGIPVIAIDPKGDLGNLLLTFPELSAADFLPWVNEDDARRSGLSLPEYAASQAGLWKEGLAQWGQDGARIERLKRSAEFSIYTPGGTAGQRLSVLRSFGAPPQAVLEDSDLLRQRINTATASLLSLLGVSVDPLRSREHILLSNILERTWRQGNDLTLAQLIQKIQTPPFEQVGAFDLESFFPARERFGLAMALNNLIAAPGFDTWFTGEPLDIDTMLYSADGRPRVSIVSISHLNDRERMFFVSLLLNEVLCWVRSQPGTTSLRALLYMDEVYGYLPPVANPPSKTPLLTLLKQSRAFGLGVMLTTQNPVDLDYKGLSNAGTWFIGRLQTEQDKNRVLDGLEGAAAGTGTRFDRRALDAALSALTTRIFLMSNVHEQEPEIFETRWALSYLSGPLTRNQIKALTAARSAAVADRDRAAKEIKAGDREAALAGIATVDATATGTIPGAVHEQAQGQAPAGGQRGAGTPAAGQAGERPAVPPDVPQYFVPVVRSRPADCVIAYKPVLFALGSVHFIDVKHGIDFTEHYGLLASIAGGPAEVDWDSAVATSIAADDLDKDPVEPASFFSLPPRATRARNYEQWRKEFSQWLYSTRKLELHRSAWNGSLSGPGETERHFKIRVKLRAQEERDRLLDGLRRKYAAKISALKERIRKAEQALAREQRQAQEMEIHSAVSVGATILGAFLGRRALSSTTLGRATGAARSAARVLKERQDVARAGENFKALLKQLDDLNAEFQEETAATARRFDAVTDLTEPVALRPKKSNVSADRVLLVWLPYFLAPEGTTAPAWES